MDQAIFRSTSITSLHQSMGIQPPLHPYISIINAANLAYGKEMVGMRFTSDMYCIAFKDAGCGIDYGRNHYDFSEGALLFTSPSQVFKVTKAQKLNQSKGWMLYFHPDLIRHSSLGASIDSYTFFDYDTHKALYLTTDERSTLNTLLTLLQNEIENQTDRHSKTLLVSHLELILNYCVRFFDRQDSTLAPNNSDLLAKVERLLKAYYQQHNLSEDGQPSIQFLAEQCHITPGYLTEILTKETGRSAKDHINDFLIEKGKHLLLSSNQSISSIAFALGFNYPHYFGRLFKQKTGKTPQAYRENRN